MYRSLLALRASPSPRPSFPYKHLCFASVRELCSNKVTKDDDQEKKTSNEKKDSKPRQVAASKVVVSRKSTAGQHQSEVQPHQKASKAEALQHQKTSKTEVQPHQKASKNIESLVKKAQNISSIGPNDPNSFSKSIGKPKTYIRQSAKSPIDAPKMLKNDEPVRNISRGLDKRLVEAARRVASKMPKNIAQATEKELIDSIKKQQNETLDARRQFETRRVNNEDYTQSISYQVMKGAERFSGSIGFFEKKNSSSDKRRSFDRSDFKVSSSSSSDTRRDTGFFSGECLNIFDPKASYFNLNKDTLFDKLLQEEIELSLDFPPKNQFEEMIKWTKEGKLWQFPINNEQGIEDDTPFYEHVLLDNLLEEFPTEGPVRQFMDVVLIGLSHNPYISVERKRETITFYKNFFEERDLLHLEKVNEASA